MKTILIYDDNVRKSDIIKDIIGKRSFGSVVINRKKVKDYVLECVMSVFSDGIFKEIESEFDYAKIDQDFDLQNNGDTRVIYCLSNFFVTDTDKVALSFKKLPYIEDTYKATVDGKLAAIMFETVQDFKDFNKNLISGVSAEEMAETITNEFEIEGLTDISDAREFISCITGNFDSRFFNSLEGDDYVIVKSSSNKKKIKAEYDFYYLLPDDMKYWFVMPFDYEESEDKASYSMERLHITDLAIKWVHGSMDEDEFSELLDRYFYFFKSRHTKECTDEEYKAKADALYIDKVNDRIAELKKHPDYARIEQLLGVCADTDLDNLVSRYFVLKDKIERGISYKKELAIGHGDPCFANALYNKSTKTLKFIDPKGATSEEELFVNPYYDVAKLSHSICGSYDFFNNGMFDVRINTDNCCELDLPVNNDELKNIFKEKVEDNGFDYEAVRIYEASLFLSMLPLHMDNPHKVLGFILNAKNILDEIEEEV